MNINVYIIDHTGSRKTAVEMPDDVPMSRLVPALVIQLDLPLQQGVNRIVFKLDHRRTGRRLGENETLASAGVQEDDVLTLIPYQMTTVPRQIKILFLASNPEDTARLRLDREVRAIDSALRQSDFRDVFELAQHWAVRTADLQGCLLRHKPDIVHFSGHGSATSEIMVEDERGKSYPLSSQALSRLFSVFKDNVKCVVLNACYSECQARAIAENIDIVIGMSKAISDTSAISFSASFYQALGYGKDIKTAFDLGCIQLDLENLGDENIPQLLSLKQKPEYMTLVQDK